ncbi:MAG: metallophosphoesterase [Fimbriiglobus sp.]|nr:metallophosphoesterase [Fimbriiglobus sp.]
MPIALRLFLFAVAWVGHAAAWTSVLSNLYGRPLPKAFLKAWRLFTGAVILAFPLLVGSVRVSETDTGYDFADGWSVWVVRYVLICLVFGGVIFPAVTVARLLRRKPEAVLAEKSEVIDFGAKLGTVAVGDGKFRQLATLPFNNALKVQFTDLRLRLKWLPAPLEGLTVLVISDLHFHGTPSRQWFDALFDHLAAQPKPDVLAFVGDYVDTDTHHEWIRPLLGKLGWTEAGVAILGNHDIHHKPDRVRAELAAVGLTVLGNGWKVVPVRGVPVVMIGHEGPWFGPPTSLMGAPLAGFRLGLSHTPDNFYWACDKSIDLVLCGHVHGGAIRVPVIGSIFVPSVYGRRFDQGVFEQGRTVMVVGRGISGREVVRVGTFPQVLRLTLTAG